MRACIDKNGNKRSLVFFEEGRDELFLDKLARDCYYKGRKWVVNFEM